MYNERPNAAPCIQRLTAFLQKVPTRTAIIAVDDGSADGTLGELRALESAIPNLIIEARPQNGGYGAAHSIVAMLAAPQMTTDPGPRLR
jgi:glycosyltransferase involved in cell wall biosynthesis